MRPCYFRPMVTVLCNHGGAYIICDLNGTLAHAPIAAFRIILYFTHKHLDLPDLEQHIDIDISVTRLRKLKETTTANPDYPDTTMEPMFREDDYVDSGSDSEAET